VRCSRRHAILQELKHFAVWAEDRLTDRALS
jgi:hypothetical protein